DTQVKAFKNLWEKDKEGFSKVLAQTEADAKFSAAIMKKVFKLNREDKYFERYMSRGEKWVEKKGADEFVMRLGVANKAKDPKQKVYFNHLSKQGYNAIVDLNDVKNYGSKEPLLFFRGTTTLGQRKSREFTQADSQKAVDTYRSQKAFDNYILDQ
ncbi:MAG: hypothetical protein H0U49_05770, partial [Parachlamydiaceae bacterium]|nr:hypothetical protein [Parachlamydiaceae bacterium]